jgi:ABC-type branched-subunit amino acid transport system substrate-binding protein
VVLLGGDLYTSRGLFPQAFQTTIPWQWQAHAIARYLVVDRKANRIVFVGAGAEANSAAGALGDALRYWGGSLSGSFVLDSPVPSEGVVLDASVRSADSAVVFGGTHDARALALAVESLPDPPRVAGPASLLAPTSAFDFAPLPGTTACYTYTWSGWSPVIPRVGAFIDAFERATGGAPRGLEQEGYDAVRTLVRGLRLGGGRGGATLTQALESTVGLAFSSFPIDLSPDDHVLLPRSELGLFAVPAPGEPLDPGQVGGPERWRPIMRTFTYDGERDSILDRDRPVFFPSWGKDQPGPFYWRSRYGIVSRPKDSVH